MRQSRFVPVAGWLSLVVLVVLAGSPTLGQAPKYGGGLTLRLREDLPQGFAIHETATISTMWPAMPCFSNLVLFDPLKATHRIDATFDKHEVCGAAGKYPRGCHAEISRLIDRQSQELNPAKRLALVQVIQRKREEAAVRPVLGWRLDYYTVWPYVKNLVPHQSIY